MRTWRRRAPPQARSRTALGVLGAVTVITILAAAMLFVGSTSAARVADNARSLHWANATRGSAAVARAAVAQAVVFGLDYEIGVASPEARATALSEAETALASLAGWVAQYEEAVGTDAELTAGFEEFTTAAAAAVEMVAAGDAAGAHQVVANRAEAAFGGLALLLDTTAGDLLDRIDGSEDTAGMIGIITRLALTLLIPVTAVLIFRAVLLRRYREARIKFKAEMTAQQEVNRAKDEFIAGVSHELRTPLTGIYGFSEVLVEGGMADRAEAVELVALIHEEAVGLTRLVEDMLVAARLDLGSLGMVEETFSVADEVGSVIGPFRRSGHALEVRCRPGMVAADRTRVRQILRNLIDNSFRHGGDHTWVLGEPRGGWYAIAVVDDGPGIPAEVEAELFERFRHSREDATVPHRVGLGLAVARSLAVRMGGDVSYRRTDNWTIFTLVLPIARVDAIVEASGRGTARPNEEQPHPKAPASGAAAGATR